MRRIHASPQNGGSRVMTSNDGNSYNQMAFHKCVDWMFEPKMAVCVAVIAKEVMRFDVLFLNVRTVMML